MAKAVVRRHLEKIEGVARTWFEWDFENAGKRTRTLVVEVSFSTDPNDPGFRENVINAIEETAKEVLVNETTMLISRLKIIPAQ